MEDVKEFVHAGHLAESVTKSVFFDESDKSDVDDDTDGENDPVPTQAHACELGVVVAGDFVDVSDPEDCLNAIHLLHVVDEISCLLIVTLQAAFMDQYVEAT